MGGEKAKDFKGSIGKLIRYMSKYKFRFVIMLIFAVAGTVFNIVGPKILGKATTELFNGLVAKIGGSGGIDFTKITQILLFTLSLYICSAIFSFIQGFIMTGISNDVTYSLRRDISGKINRLPLKYYESRTTGEILSRVTNDVDTLQNGLNQSITQLITSVTTLIGVFIMMLSINVWMTLAAVLILPLSMGIIGTVMKRSQKFFRNQQRYLGEVNGQIEEVYGGHDVVKVFNKEKDVVEAFEKVNKELYNSAWKSQFFSGIMMPVMQFIGNLGYVVVAILGGFLVIKNAIEVGDIQSFFQYIRNFTQPIQQIAQAKEVVLKKEDGLDTEVEQGGKNFSGGQRQRLTIARALVKKPEILILDDSSSALDFATDAALRMAIGAMEDKPTLFIVSQRTSAIQYADQIVVLDDGNVVGLGTHEELMDSCEVYREIYESQYKKSK